MVQPRNTTLNVSISLNSCFFDEILVKYLGDKRESCPFRTASTNNFFILRMNSIINQNPSHLSQLKTEIMEYAASLGVSTETHIEYVVDAILSNPDLANTVRPKKGKKQLTREQIIEKWVGKFHKGYLGRISQRKSNPPGTIPDLAVEKILIAAMPDTVDEVTASKLVYAHRLCMSAENILGLLLEEFLFEELSALGWACAWGETIKAVDFCCKDGRLLQVKNRSNSENSSSSKIREGTNIHKWYRVNANSGEYLWADLQHYVGNCPTLTEENFNKFIERILTNNPDAFAIEDGNCWA